jgi:hypothetical protein
MDNFIIIIIIIGKDAISFMQGIYTYIPEANFYYYYYYYYLAGCTIFSHHNEPIYQLYNLLSLFASVVRVLFH